MDNSSIKKATRELQVNIFRRHLKNEPEKTISDFGIKNCRMLSGLLLKICKKQNPYELEIVEEHVLPDDKPVLFVGTHIRKDDIINGKLMIKRPFYLLFGILEEFLKTVNGKRTDDYAFLGDVYNLSPNKLVNHMDINIYESVKSNDALVVPIIQHFEDSKCYGIVGEPIDVTKYNKEDLLYIIKKIKSYVHKVIELVNIDEAFADKLDCEYGGSISNQPLSINIKVRMNEILILIDHQLMRERNEKELMELVSNCIYIASSTLTELGPQDKFLKDNNYDEILKRVINFLKSIVYVKKAFVVDGRLRNIMATSVYKLFEEYSFTGGYNYAGKKRIKELLDATVKTESKKGIKSNSSENKKELAELHMSSNDYCEILDQIQHSSNFFHEDLKEIDKVRDKLEMLTLRNGLDNEMTKIYQIILDDLVKKNQDQIKPRTKAEKDALYNDGDRYLIDLWEQEQSHIIKQLPTEDDPVDVFAPLDKVVPTPENELILGLTRNKKNN